MKNIKQLYDFDYADYDHDTWEATCQSTSKTRNRDQTFLEAGNYNAFTTNFEDLYGMQQLPGLAVQRLMAEGYGFAGEGIGKQPLWIGC